ncbi:MAG: hypothetical protein ACI4TM_03640 [Candidatus Cryptobacteroides sp.]
MALKIKSILLAAMVALAFLIPTGCVKENLSEANLQTSEISLSKGGKVLAEYNAAKWQTGYNKAHAEYRVYTDDMSQYFILQCSEEIDSEGQEIKADLKYYLNGNRVKAAGLDFVVQKIGKDGMIWLWNASSKYGAVIYAPAVD